MNWEKIAELKVIYVQPPTGSNSVIASRKADPYDYVVSVNERRRHLTIAQRSEVAEKLLRSPEQKSLTTEATGQSGSAGIKIRQQMAFVGKRQGPGDEGRGAVRSSSFCGSD